MSVETIAALRPISADSHICEPPNCFLDHIEAAWLKDAPRVVREDNHDRYVLKDFPPIPMPLVAAAGRDPREVGIKFTTYEEMHPGGWDAKARLADQDRDGVAAEVIYPTVGMALCHLEDADYKQACMWAYNRWLQEEFVAVAPDRLFGIGLSAIRSIDEAITDFRRIKEMGFKGVMLPANPATAEDYDDPSFDPLWRVAAELGLPISFHILTGKDAMPRGPKITRWNGVMRGVQDIIGMFVFSGVFCRHPGLKLVCVEGDAGWLPHYAYRMDHAYNRHRFVDKCRELSRMPSELLFEHVYLTFQDDLIAFRVTDMLNPKRLMWANDFPHNDSTWPNSQKLLAEHTRDLAPHDKQAILRDNVRELYQLPVT
jgi:predicted TIM-barrel fold metal-dependent hydrolase